MTTQEFSHAFDTVLNSYANKAAIGDQSSIRDIVLDEYEKSCFLSLAQEQLIISYYNGNNNSLVSFEKTEEIRRYLSSLVKTKTIPIIEGYLYNNAFYEDGTHTQVIPGNSEATYIDNASGGSYKCTIENNTPVYTRIDNGYISDSSIMVPLPEGLWFITYESGKINSIDSCLNNKEIEVIPVTQDAYYKTKENPFKTTGQRRALRLDVNGDMVELVSKYDLKQYLVRYLEKPAPIILTNLEGLSIDGVSTAQTCQLIESLHRPILEQAVILALRSRGINLNNNQQ